MTLTTVSRLNSYPKIEMLSWRTTRKQEGVGWSFVESTSLSPIAQSMSDKLSRQVSIKQLQDRLLVEMPGVDNPEPDNMTDEQIRQYQEGINRAYKPGGSAAMVDPDTLPTDTVVIRGQSRGSSLPIPKRYIKEPQKVRINTQSNTPRGSSFFGPRLKNNTGGIEDPFLGQHYNPSSDQTANATPFPSPRTTPREAHRQSPLATRNACENLSASPQTSSTLSQYFPRLQFLRPSHFANLGTSSYRRPTPLLPAHLRPREQQRQAVEEACINNSTITSTPKKAEQRSRMYRQERKLSHSESDPPPS